MAALNMPAQRARGAPSGKFDVFLSHAGTEKLGPIGDLHAAFSRDYPHIQCFLDCLDLQKGQPNGDDMKLYARTASAAVVYLSPAYLIRKWPFLELCIFFDERRRRLSIGDSEGPSKGGSRSAIWEGEVDPAWGDRPGSPANPMHIVPLFHGLAFEELDEFRTAVAKTGGQGIAQLEVWKRYIANHTPQDQLILQGNLDTFLRKHMQDEGKKRVWLEVVDWIKGFSGHVMNKSILEAGQVRPGRHWSFASFLESAQRFKQMLELV